MISSDLKVSSKQFSSAIKQLGEFVAIPSVSDPESSYYSMKTLSNAAGFAKSKLEKLCFQARCIRVNGSAPYLIAK